MKIVLDSYNCFKQNTAGGVQTRIANFYSHLKEINENTYFFNKWKDKIEECDIIHFFKLSIDHYQLMVYAKNKNIPIVLSSIVPIEGFIKIKFNLFVCKILPIHTIFNLHKKMLDLTDAIIAQTNKEKNFIMKAYNVRASKIYVLPNGISNTILNGNPFLIKNALLIQQDFILQVGRIDKNKNQLSVIRAMKNSTIPVVFVGGSDPAEPEYYEQCKKEATSNIFFLGWLAQDNPLLASAYAAAKVIILPSYKEIFGNSAMEGIATKSNVVISNTLPVGEWGLNNYVTTVNPNSVTEIQDALYSAYNKDINDDLHLLILNKFSWHSVAVEHLNIYKSICNK